MRMPCDEAEERIEMEEEVFGSPPPVQTQAEVFVFSEHAIIGLKDVIS